MSTSKICEPQFSTTARATWELYSRCIHCGLCLNQCPTYRVLGTEMDSPRGRIYQVLQVDAGRLQLSDFVVLHMDRCLGCLACESACPSGVQYGRILERARAEVSRHYERGFFSGILRKWFYRSVVTSRSSLVRWAVLLRAYQRSGLQRLARSSGVLRIVGLKDIEALAPAIESNFFYSEFGKTFPAKGERRARVAMLAGCIANVTSAELNRATIRVLQKNGIEVVVPEGQGCCGALSAHAGYLEDARELARRNIDAFCVERIDAVVNNAGGCGAALKEYGDWLEDDPAYAERARQFSSSVRDVSEFLTEVGLRSPVRLLNEQVTYQDSCHLAHAQKVRSAPRELLRAIGAELVEVPRADSCCGSAGTYSVSQNELSMKILDEKMRDIATTGADVIAVANTGCLLQLKAGAVRSGCHMQVKHIVELLDECY